MGAGVATTNKPGYCYWTAVGAVVGAAIGILVGLFGWGPDGIAYGSGIGAGIGVAVGTSRDAMIRRREHGQSGQ